MFLFVADLAARKIYYCSVEEYIRSQYENLAKQDSITFKLMHELNIESKIGLALFEWFVYRERAHNQFVFHITNLLSHIQSFCDFITHNQSRDFFLEIESERHLQFRALYESCRMAAVYLDREWNVESLADLCKRDFAEWEDKNVYLHEGTLDFILQKLHRIFPELVLKAWTLVSQTQGAYWREQNPIFYKLCKDLEWHVKHLGQRMGISAQIS